MKKKLLGYYDYTVILTYVGMLFAFWGITQAIGLHFEKAMIGLMFAGICDMFDGTVANTKDRTVPEKRFGIQIDSLCDLIGFGVLPGLFLYMFMGGGVVPGFIAGLYILCGLIRLAYFNVTEEERQDSTTETRKLYQGIPVTTVALALPLVFWIYDFGILPEIAFPILLLLLAIGFISPLKVQKPGNVGKIFVILIGVANFVIIARDLLFLNK